MLEPRRVAVSLSGLSPASGSCSGRRRDRSRRRASRTPIAEGMTGTLGYDRPGPRGRQREQALPIRRHRYATGSGRRSALPAGHGGPQDRAADGADPAEAAPGPPSWWSGRATRYRGRGRRRPLHGCADAPAPGLGDVRPRWLSARRRLPGAAGLDEHMSRAADEVSRRRGVEVRLRHVRRGGPPGRRSA